MKDERRERSLRELRDVLVGKGGERARVLIDRLPERDVIDLMDLPLPRLLRRMLNERIEECRD